MCGSVLMKSRLFLQRGGHFLVVVAVDLAEALGHAVAEAYGLHTLKAEAALFRHRTDGHFVEVIFW